MLQLNNVLLQHRYRVSSALYIVHVIHDNHYILNKVLLQHKYIISNISTTIICIQNVK